MIKGILVIAGRVVREAFLRLEEKPLAVVLVACGATVAVALALASYGGWPRVLRILYAPHSWAWLGVCLLGELIAYLGYVLSVRDVGRVDGGPDLDAADSTQTVVAGFGVFAATRSSGGFAVDYWAFREAGATRRDALTRVLALGILEYLVLGIAALIASVLLFFDLDGQANYATTLPSLIIIPFVAIAVWATSPRRVHRLKQTSKSSGRMKTLLANTVDGASKVRNMTGREYGLGLLGMILYWTGDLLCLWAALQLVGGRHLTISALVLAYSGGYVLTRRSLPAGGAGLVEVALTLALHWMGLALVPALIGVVIYRLFNFWLPIVPALLLMPAIRELRSRFQPTEDQPSSK